MPALQRADRAANFAFHELGAMAMTGTDWLLPAFRAIGRWQINKAIKDPELRRKVTPTDEVGCKRVMLTDEWYPTLTRPNVSLDDRSNRADRPGWRADCRRSGAGRRTCSSSPPVFETHGFVTPMEVIGAGGVSLAAALERLSRAPISA